MELCGKHLSVREYQITKLIEQGLSNKAIGKELGITEGTTKVYLSHIFNKLGIVRNGIGGNSPRFALFRIMWNETHETPTGDIPITPMITPQKEMKIA
jgi:DNA-binding NarL/FixJ family response regulator